MFSGKGLKPQRDPEGTLTPKGPRRRKGPKGAPTPKVPRRGPCEGLRRPAAALKGVLKLQTQCYYY